MTELEQKSFTYKTGTIESSRAIVAVRILVGLPIGVVAAFIGSIFNNIAVPNWSAGNVPVFLVPLIVTGLFAASGGMIVWFNRFESRRGVALLWAASTAGGLLGAFIAYYFGDRYGPPIDLDDLHKWISQLVLLGASIGANALAALVAVLASRSGR